MTLHTKSISNAFNSAALTYDQYANVQAVAGKKIIDDLTAHHTNFPRILDAGCGTGLTTKRLAESIQYESIIAIDIADHLLACASARFPDDIQCLSLNFDNLSILPESFHLIFSNMSLQWSISLPNTLKLFHKKLVDSGLLAFTIPLHGTLVEIENYFSINQFPTLSLVSSQLVNAQYRVIAAHQHTYCESFQDSLTALRSIKRVGAHQPNHRQQSKIGHKALLASNRFHQLSYVIGFFIAEKQS